MSAAMPETGRRWAWAATCLVLAATPFLSVDFIPSTDLPQHLGQLRLFAEAWANPGGELEIHWWTPYGLVYALLALPWLLLPPVLGGKIGVLLIVLILQNHGAENWPVGIFLALALIWKLIWDPVLVALISHAD